MGNDSTTTQTALNVGDSVLVTRLHDGNSGREGQVTGMEDGFVNVQFADDAIYRYRREDLAGPLSPVGSRSTDVPQVGSVVRIRGTRGYRDDFEDQRGRVVAPDALAQVPAGCLVVHLDSGTNIARLPSQLQVVAGVGPVMPRVDATSKVIPREVATAFFRSHGWAGQASHIQHTKQAVRLVDAAGTTIALVEGEHPEFPDDVEIPGEAAIRLTPANEGLAAVLSASVDEVPDELVDDVINVVQADGDIPAALAEAIKLKLREDPSWRPQDEEMAVMTEQLLHELCGAERHIVLDGPHGSVCLLEPHGDKPHEWTRVTSVPEVEPAPLIVVRGDGPWSQKHEMGELAVERQFNEEQARRVPDTTEERVTRYLPPPPITAGSPRTDLALARAEIVLADARRAVVQLEHLIAELRGQS